MTAGQKRFDDWLAGRAEQAGGRAAFLRADGRADESHWESIRRNVFSLFRDVLSAAQKANGGEEQAARRFFAEKLGVALPPLFHFVCDCPLGAHCRICLYRRCGTLDVGELQQVL